MQSSSQTCRINAAMTPPVDHLNTHHAGCVKVRAVTRILCVLLLAGMPARGVEAQDADAPTVNTQTQPCEPADTCSTAEEPPEAVPSRHDPQPEPPADPRLTLLGTASAAMVPMLLFHAMALGLGAAAGVLMMVATIPSSQNADGLACLGMMCVVGPLQGVLLAGATAAGLVAGPVASWGFTSVALRKRVAVLPGWLLMHLPAVPMLAVAAAVQWVLQFGGCFCSVCGSLCFSSFLVSVYDWPGQNAEFYALRRCGPPIFFGCFFITQALVGSVSLTGSALAALVAGLWAMGTGRMMNTEETGPYLDPVWVPDEQEEDLAEEEFEEEEMEDLTDQE